MKMDKEAREWREIPGFEGRYLASRDGYIKVTYKDGRDRFLKPFLRLRGGDPRNRMAMFVCLRRADGMRLDYPVISLVAKAWLGKSPAGMIAIPRDGSIRNNSVENVLYVAREELDKISLKTLREETLVEYNGWQIMRLVRKRRGVVKVNREYGIVERYESIHAAARANYMSDACIRSRCDGTMKKRWADDGTTFLWEDMLP